MDVAEQIRAIATGRFPQNLIEEFVRRFHEIRKEQEIFAFFLQISRDQGDELELGFFTEHKIADITLSNGKVYFKSFPFSELLDTRIIESESKTTLLVQGAVRFDYNILDNSDLPKLVNYQHRIAARLCQIQAL